MHRHRELTILSLLMAPLMVVALFSTCAAAPLVVERNLFAQDRKPPTDEPASAPHRKTPGLSAKAIQLDGVFMHGDKKEALIRLKGHAPGKPRSKDASPYVTVREGERIDEYQVVKIEPRSVSLEKDGETVVVNLFAEGKIVPPAPPAPAAPGQPEGGQAAPGQPEGQQGHGTMRLPHPIPPPGQPGGQPPGFNPETGQPPPGNEQISGQETPSTDEDGSATSDDDEQVEEDEGTDDSN